MTTTHRFRPEYRTIARVPPTATLAQLDQEVGMYSATPEFAAANGGPIVRNLVSAVPASFRADAAARGLYLIADIRIHRLYPGQFPSVPGWHADASFRDDYFAQPDLGRTPDTQHLLCTVSSQPEGVSNTEFIDEELVVAVDQPEQGGTVWQQVHREVQRVPRRTTRVPDGDLIQFSSWTLHRPTPARIRGWRLFFRLSMYHRPPMSAGGLLSKQEMVYVVDESLGW